jgi:hypothetical protein
VGSARFAGQVVLIALVLLHATLAGPTNSSPGGTNAVLLAVDGSDWST